MTVYTAVITGNFSANTDSLAIEIDAPANTTIKIKKIRVTDGDGTGLTTNDYHRKVKLVTQSVAGTGGSTYTPTDIDDNSTSAVSTVKTGPMTVGTISSTIDLLSVHSGTDFFWQASDEDDKIVVTPGSIFGIVISPAN